MIEYIDGIDVGSVRKSPSRRNSMDHVVLAAVDNMDLVTHPCLVGIRDGVRVDRGSFCTYIRTSEPSWPLSRPIIST